MHVSVSAGTQLLLERRVTHSEHLDESEVAHILDVAAKTPLTLALHGAVQTDTSVRQSRAPT